MSPAPEKYVLASIGHIRTSQQLWFSQLPHNVFSIDQRMDAMCSAMYPGDFKWARLLLDKFSKAA
jgi:hypothetical protein